MAFLCQYHLNKIKKDPSFAQQTWGDMMGIGYQAHSNHNFNKATQYFTAACQVAGAVLENSPHVMNTSKQSSAVINMLIKAHHNLAANLCAQKLYRDAEKILAYVHNKLLLLVQSEQVKRQIKIDALASLDNTLFTLTALLGSIGKLEEVHNVIDTTEEVAVSAAQQLFH